MEVNLNDYLSNEKQLSSVVEKPDVRLPFNLLVFQNLLDEKTVQQLRDDVNSSVRLKKKDNDLYKFKQSKDLLSETPAKKLTPLIHKFIDVMQDDVRRHLEKMTGKQLSSKNFDITASRYDVGNYLLCHNDDIKDSLKNHRRTLAFVYYLTTRPWTKQDGGSLMLFESDSTGEPVKVSNTISPRPNTLVIFETTDTSWHSVEEVFCKDDFRLSINGWFHTDDVKPDVDALEEDLLDRRIEPCPFNFVRPNPLDARLESFFKDYFNPEYLMEKTCLLIKKRFERKSEINLTNFLNKDKFNEINEALKKTVSDREHNLEHVGPYNKRNYMRIRVDKLPQVCKDLYDAFRSELFFMFLSRITGLCLQPPSLKGDDASSQANSSQDSGSDSEEFDESDDSDLDLEDEESDDDDDDDLEEEIESENTPSLSQERQAKQTQSIVDVYKDEKSTASAPDAGAKQPTTSKQRSQEADKNQPKKRRRTADPLVRHEFRHLDAGSYTLIHDHGFEMGEKSALDVILHFNHDFEVNFEDGGYISYIDGAPEDDLHSMDYELLTVEPKSNCLSLAYRCDEGTCRFLKYISKSHKSAYQDLYCVYYERPDDLPPNCASHISSASNVE